MPCIIKKCKNDGGMDSFGKINGYHKNQRTNGPVNAHLKSWPSKAQSIQNLENIW